MVGRGGPGGRAAAPLPAEAGGGLRGEGQEVLSSRAVRNIVVSLSVRSLFMKTRALRLP